MIEQRLGPVSVSGRIVDVDLRPDGKRITLEKLQISRLRQDRTPERVRVRVRSAGPAVHPGDWIRLRAVLTPPGAPSAPGAFDFQRRSFFRQLGGVGFAYGGAEVIARAGADGGPIGFVVGLSRLRHDLATKIRVALPEPTGAVAAALMTGHKGAIPALVMDRIRDAGLAHLLAISGLHIGLVAGILFVGLRAAMALVGPLALRAPIKKWAAVAAILGAFAYALIAGATVPTLRAFLMIGLMLLGVVFDRRGLSVRSVAWAATVLLVMQPEGLLGASFQMSFAAVTALIAVYEALRGKALTPMGWGIDAVIAISAAVAAWPGSVHLIPAMPTWGLVLVALGGAWLCLWRPRRHCSRAGFGAVRDAAGRAGRRERPPDGGTRRRRRADRVDPARRPVRPRDLAAPRRPGRRRAVAEAGRQPGRPHGLRFLRLHFPQGRHHRRPGAPPRGPVRGLLDRRRGDQRGAGAPGLRRAGAGHRARRPAAVRRPRAAHRGRARAGRERR